MQWRRIMVIRSPILSTVGFSAIETNLAARPSMGDPRSVEYESLFQSICTSLTATMPLAHDAIP